MRMTNRLKIAHSYNSEETRCLTETRKVDIGNVFRCFLWATSLKKIENIFLARKKIAQIDSSFKIEVVYARASFFSLISLFF